MKQWMGLPIIMAVLVMTSVSVVAAEFNVANSQDWRDVYSVLLRSALDDERALFTSSESVSAFVRSVARENELTIYESNRPYIPSMEPKVVSAGYTVASTIRGSDFNLELDPRSGRYLVISESNYRLAVSVAPVAVYERRWVLIVNEDNIVEIVSRLQGASDVLAVGTFPRSTGQQIQPYTTSTIRTNNIFTDSQRVSERMPTQRNILLTDGTILESEFFFTQNPVLITGGNRILDDSFAWLTSRGVENVILVGNQLSVVGEQIRTRSERKINVFVKFGQSDADNTGRIYALSTFPLPVPQVGMDIQRVIYSPSDQQLVAYYRNTGNIGLYAITTLSVKTDSIEVGAASDDEVIFIGAGETLPIVYPMSIAPQDLDESTIVEFFTSFGLSPTELDSFLTMINRYGPPFSIPLVVEDLSNDPSQLALIDATYFTNLRRIGVEVENTGPERTYYTVRIRQLTVNGLREDFTRSDQIAPGQTKMTYIPVVLDEVDIVENEHFTIEIVYGNDPESQLKAIRERLPFKTAGGNLLLGLVTGAGSGLLIGALIFVVIIALVAGIIIYIRRRM